MTVPKINSSHGSETRNIINAAIDSINVQGKSIQDLVAEGQLTPAQYSQLLKTINGLIAKGDIETDDLSPTFKNNLITLENLVKEHSAKKMDVNDVIKMSQLSQDVKEALTGGSTAVVGKRSVNSINLQGEAYQAMLKTNIIENYDYEYINIFDKENVTEGSRISETDGKIYPNVNYFYSHRINVSPGQKITMSTNSVYVAFYNSSNTFISGAIMTDKITAPAGASYVILSPKLVDKDTFMVVKGDVTLNEYYPYLDGKKKTRLNLEIDENNIDKFLTSVQLIDFDDIDNNGAVGYLNESGGIAVNDTWRTTDFIELDDDIDSLRVVHKEGLSRIVVFYDNNYKFISYNLDVTFPKPSNARYAKISIKKENGVYESVMLTADKYVQTVQPFKKVFKPNLIPPINKDMISGDLENANEFKLQLFGDSITDESWGDNKTWVTFARNIFGSNVAIDNQAVGGSKLSNDGVRTDAVVDIINDGATLSDNNDVIFVWAGTNDWSRSQSLGEFLSDDITTIHGATKNIIEEVSQNNVLLIFATPLKRNHTSDDARATNNQGLKVNDNGDTLNDFSQAILKTCEWYGIPCIDLNKESGINEVNARTYTSDGLHPFGNSDRLEKRLAKMITSVMKKYV